MALDNSSKRLETMRKITKGPTKASITEAWVWLVKEHDTGITLSIWSDEENANLAADEIFYIHGVDCDVEPMTLDSDNGMADG